MTEGGPGPLAQGAAAGVATAAAGGTLHEIVAATASPSLALLARLSWDEMRDARQRSAEAFVGEAASRMDVTPQRLVTMPKSNEGQQLYMDGFAASLETLNETKVRGFARAVAAGLLDDEARVDEGLLIVSAIRDMETPHIRALGKLYELRPREGQVTLGSFGRVSASSLAELAGVAPAVSAAIVAALERHGVLVRSQREAHEATAGQLTKVLRAQADDERRRLQMEGIGGFVPTREPPRIEPVSPTQRWYLSDFGASCWVYLTTPEPDPEQTPDADGSQ